MKFKNGIREKNIIVKCGADIMLPFSVTFAAYIILFGTVSPGGGFQGGVMVAAAALLLYLGHGYNEAKNTINTNVLRTGEALGATLYIFLAFAGVFVGASFCQNIFFNNGNVGDIISGGTVTFMSYSVGFKVLTGVGFLLMLLMSLLAPEDNEEEEE